MTDTDDRTPRRPGRTAHGLTVARVDRPVPSVVSVTLHGDSLSAFTEPKPGGHVKIVFDQGDGGRATMRTYTPRRVDRDRCELDIEFVLHGDGVAARWAAGAQIGDQLTVMGPGGHYQPSAPSGTFVIAVDDTAIPAAGTVIEALSSGVDIIALCEVTDADDERALSPTRELDVAWLHRAPSDAEPGALLHTAVAALPVDLDADWFVACEAGAMRRIRSHLRDGRQIAPERLHTRGYWRRGETDYPDHDYGEG